MSFFMDLRKSSCMRPAAENTRSTPAEEAGVARYCLAILASFGQLDSRFFHQLSSWISRSSSGSARYSSSSSRSVFVGVVAPAATATDVYRRLPRLTLRFLRRDSVSGVTTCEQRG